MLWRIVRPILAPSPKDNGWSMFTQSLGRGPRFGRWIAVWRRRRGRSSLALPAKAPVIGPHIRLPCARMARRIGGKSCFMRRAIALILTVVAGAASFSATRQAAAEDVEI